MNRFTASTARTQPPPAPQPSAHTYYEEIHFPFCEDVSNYDRITKIGQGTFG